MRIGVDLGGTKTEVIALGQDGDALFRTRNSTPRGCYADIVDNIAALVQLTEQETGQTGTVGVGIPGTLSPRTGLVKNANTTELIGHPFETDLSERLARPVRLANDANCFALSEATDGAGAGRESVFGIILGTGVGGGIVVHGRVLTGRNAIAGEWGHSPLPWANQNERPGPDCYCGKKGCIETFLSGPGLSASHDAVGSGGPTPAEIVRLAEQEQDAAAERTLASYERRLAKALAHVINILDPEIIVCGGGLSNLDRIYENVPRLWQEYAFSDGIDTPFVKARHGDSSGVRGAAWLWPPAA
ncbi:ROK family protein [Sneathiella chinensis]|uniref:N-acetylglucosamine kinase n=1 Tax=Sneathiella chinensis TaxID=349750 RepID=A0ABQ5UAS4_9PROT|nr:ROK family protein [Sneathiella chinensis]GLQ07676.1 N-acetylglucosamine kinase [Sneathiella chinensis]